VVHITLAYRRRRRRVGHFGSGNCLRSDFEPLVYFVKSDDLQISHDFEIHTYSVLSRDPDGVGNLQVSTAPDKDENRDRYAKKKHREVRDGALLWALTPDKIESSSHPK